MVFFIAVSLLLVNLTGGCIPLPGSNRVHEPSATVREPKAGFTSFDEITAENIRQLNRERERSELPPLKVSIDLSAVADWIARTHLQTGDDASTVEIRNQLDKYSGLAVVSFAMNRSSATGSYGDDFLEWFAENRAGDVTGSQGVRNNLLDPDMAQVGVACVGVPVTENGRQQYKMVFVWLFTPQPPPGGFTSYQHIAQDNIAILNDERASRGLSRLAVDSELNALALEKARDLVQYDYFDHYSERLGSPHEMIVARVVPLPKMTAENLWKVEGTYHGQFLNGTAQQAHEGLMNSEGHRKNLLHTDYTHIGVACVGGIVNRPEGKLYQVVLVQLFIKEN
jgi:uncharacterized protein YkwD